MRRPFLNRPNPTYSMGYPRWIIIHLLKLRPTFTERQPHQKATVVRVLFAVKIFRGWAKPRKLNAQKFFMMNNNHSQSEMNRRNFLTWTFIIRNFGLRKNTPTTVYSNFVLVGCWLGRVLYGLHYRHHMYTLDQLVFLVHGRVCVTHYCCFMCACTWVQVHVALKVFMVRGICTYIVHYDFFNCHTHVDVTDVNITHCCT